MSAGQELEISVADGRIELEVAPTPMHLERRGGRLVAVPELELQALTTEQVRETLEQIRR